MNIKDGDLSLVCGYTPVSFIFLQICWVWSSSVSALSSNLASVSLAFSIKFSTFFFKSPNETFDLYRGNITCSKSRAYLLDIGSRWKHTFVPLPSRKYLCWCLGCSLRTSWSNVIRTSHQLDYLCQQGTFVLSAKPALTKNVALY